MAATAAWRAYVARSAARVYPLIQITRQDGEVFRYTHGASGVGQADIVRVSEIRQEFDETGGSIPLPTMEFVHSNRKRDFERLLEGPVEMRGAAVQLAFASPDLDSSDWYVRFTGRISTWSYSDAGITVKCRHDDGPIRNSSIPALPIVRPEWGKTDLGYGTLVVPDGVDGLYIPLLYGEWASAGMGEGGVLPTICVGFKDNGVDLEHGTAEYLIALGVLPDIGTELVVYDLNGDTVAFSYASRAYRGGKTVTVFGFSDLAPVAKDAVYKVDCKGYEPVGDGTGATITNPVAQLRHFLNIVYGGYRTGTWPTAAAPLAGSTWDAAETWADSFGLEGAAYIGGSTTSEQAKDIVERWLRSFPCFRLFWNEVGQLEILIFDPTVWQGYPDASSRRLSTRRIKRGSLSPDMDDSRLVRRVSSTLRYAPADGTGYLSVDVIDMLQEELAALPQRLDWASAAAVDVTRQQTSRQLRVIRRPTRTFDFSAPLEYADLRPGSTLFIDGGQIPSGDGAGATRLKWSSRAVLVKSAAPNPTTREVAIVGLDPREMQVSFWSPLHTDLGAGDDDNGVAIIHQGTAPACVRAQLGWRRRPGDQSFRDALAAAWRISPWGLSICGGSGAAADGVLTWQPPNNGFTQGTPPTYTGWTTTGVIFTSYSDGEFLFDADGYRQSAWPEATATLANTSAVAVTNGRRIRVYFVWADFVGEPMLRLEDTAAGKWYDFAAGTWGASNAWRTPANVVSGGGSYKLHDWHYELWSAEIVCDAHASPTLKIHVGNNTGAGATAYIICLAGFVIPDTNAGAGSRPIRRSPIVTTAAGVAQAADIVSIDNAGGAILTSDKGEVSLAFVPYWDFADLEDGQKKSLWYLHVDPAYGGGDAWLGAYLQRDGAALEVHFYMEQGGATLADAVVSGAVAEFMGDPIRVAFRWTGAEGEHDTAPYTLDVWLAGTKGTGATCSSTPTAVAAGSKLYVGSYGTDTPAHAFADGEISHLECRLFPRSDDEIARTLSALAVPALPEDA